MIVSRILESSLQRRLLGQLNRLPGEKRYERFLPWRKIRIK